MKRTIAVLILLFTVVAAWSQPADVLGWGATRWGMSVEQVAAAVGAPWKSAVQLIPGLIGDRNPTYRVVFERSYGWPLCVDFYFVNSGLYTVSIYLNRDLASCLREMVAAYKAPTAILTQDAMGGGYADEPSVDYRYYWVFPASVIELVKSDYWFVQNKEYQKSTSGVEIKNDLLLWMPTPTYVLFSKNESPPWLP